MIIYRLAILVLIFLLSAFQTFPTNTPISPDPITRRLILISADGLRPDAIQLAPMPNLLALAENGAVAWDAQTVYPSVTLPAHTTMLTGLSIEAHGITFNDTPTPCEPISTPTFLTVAAESGYSVGIVVGKEKFCIYDQSDLVDYTFAREGDRSVIDRAIELLDEGVEVLFIHLPNPDYFGHLTTWMSPIYIGELRNTDFHIGRLLTALDEREIRDETLIMLTADHGGHGFGHGTDLPEDMTIPLIISGNSVEAGTIVEDGRNADAALTAFYALGLDVPESDAGRVLLEVFEVGVIS